MDRKRKLSENWRGRLHFACARCGSAVWVCVDMPAYQANKIVVECQCIAGTPGNRKMMEVHREPQEATPN
jgi:hypothetical protein